MEQNKAYAYGRLTEKGIGAQLDAAPPNGEIIGRGTTYVHREEYHHGL